MKLIITERNDERSREVVEVTGVEVDTGNNRLLYVMPLTPNSIEEVTMETSKRYFITSPRN